MAQQRLYTEEQIRKMWFQDYIFDIDDILDSEIPIELPSDEEIEEQAKECYFELHKNLGVFNGYISGAKWMRNKILNK